MFGHWSVCLFIAWVMWIGKIQGGHVMWQPMREYLDEEMKSPTPQERCESLRAAFRMSHPDFHKRLRCLPAGERPDGALNGRF